MESPLRHPTEPDFRLIETLGFQPAAGFVRRQMHLDRMARTARALGLEFDRNQAGACLAHVSGNAPLRCRLTMDVHGRFELQTAPLAPAAKLWRVAIANDRLNSVDPWLRHKTTRRHLYDKARASLPAGIDELLFQNERDELCEGTITNLFVTRSDGQIVTPPLSSGVLPGILRQELLDQGRASERVVTLDDLRSARVLSVGNSLRGQIRAELVDIV